MSLASNGIVKEQTRHVKRGANAIVEVPPGVTFSVVRVPDLYNRAYEVLHIRYFKDPDAPTDLGYHFRPDGHIARVRNRPE